MSTAKTMTMAKKQQKAGEARARRIPPVPAAVVGLLCKAQVCDALGGCSTRMISLMVKDGRFPPADARLGRNPRWSVAAVNRWCEQQQNNKEG